jgi:hypothetical protein
MNDPKWPLFENRYFQWHRKYGVLRVNLLKAVVALIVAAQIGAPVAGMTPLFLIGGYCSVVVVLLVDSIKQTRREK